MASSMADSERRKATQNYSKPGVGVIGGKNPMYGRYQPATNITKPPHDSAYFANGHVMPQEGNDRFSSFAEDFGRLGLQNSAFSSSNRVNTPMTNAPYEGGISLNSIPQAYVCNGQVVFTGSQVHPGIPPGQNGFNQQSAMYQTLGPPFVGQGNFQYPANMMGNNSPISSWPSSRVPSSEMPTLVTPRRDSSSSNEHDAPGTPFTQYTGYGDYTGGVTVIDRSPHSLYWSTPSSTQNGYKAQNACNLTPKLQLLLSQDPAIPSAVPAPYSPRKPLDRALENANGVTNVYIRGLQPNTTDEKLYALASRFGDIVSSKSIIDHSTGLCKGYGFVKYHNFKDAEECIRGFHYMGYETSFARESFYSQLKKLADEENTNLYVSNLPKDMNEHELGEIFLPYKVCSSRILRDGAGNGRGVGFARFETRDVCEEIIKMFNNKPVPNVPGGEEYPIQIRYADTQDQKALKQQTAAARQYRTAEYESQTQSHSSLTTPCRPNLAASNGSVAENDFENYMAMSTVPVQATQGSGRSPMNDRLTNVAMHLETKPTCGLSGHENSCLTPSGVEIRPSTEGSKSTVDDATLTSMSKIADNGPSALHSEPTSKD